MGLVRRKNLFSGFFLLGCRSALDRVSDKKLFLAMFEKIIAICQKPVGKSSPAVRIPYRNRSGVVELFGRDCLLFARVEISSNKIYFLNTYLPPPPAKTHFHLKFWSSNNSNFSTGFFQLSGRGEPTFLRGGATTSKLEFDLCSLCVTHHM